VEMAKQHRITYNSNTKDASIIHLPNKKVKFTKTEQGLYTSNPRSTNLKVHQLNSPILLTKTRPFLLDNKSKRQGEQESSIMLWGYHHWQTSKPSSE
jgi:hypothetical protein